MIPVYCPLCCDQPFEDQDGLFHHLRSLRNNLFCPICSERFPSFDFLLKHLSRKCNGPASPREAKRKCLLNTSNIPETLPDSPVNTSTVPQPEKITPKDDMEIIPITAPPSEIPPEIKSRLPRGVTLVLNSATPTQQSTAAAKPSETPTNNSSGRSMKNVSLKPSVSTPTQQTPVMKASAAPNNIAPGRVIRKVSLNPTVATPTQQTTAVKPSATPTTDSLGRSLNPSVVINSAPIKDKDITTVFKSRILSNMLTKGSQSKTTENDTKSTPSLKQSSKSGPLLSKTKGNEVPKNPSDVQKEVITVNDKSPSVLKQPSKSGYLLSISKGIDSVKNLPDVPKEGAVNNENDNTITRKRGRPGRPRKYFLEDMNGIVTEERVPKAKSSIKSILNQTEVNSSGKVAEVNNHITGSSGKKTGTDSIKSILKQTELSSKKLTEDNNHKTGNRIGTRGKKISFSKLVGSEISDSSDGGDNGDDSSYNSDKNSESEEEEINKRTKVFTEDKINHVDKGEDKNPVKDFNAKVKELLGKPVVKNTDTNKSSNKSLPKTVEDESKDNVDLDQPITAKEEPDDEDSEDGSGEEGEEEAYTCSACNIKFISIYEHIKEYHNGQEVVVEVPPEEIEGDVKAYQENTALVGRLVFGEGEDVDKTGSDNDENSIAKEGSVSGSKSDTKRKKEIRGFSSEDGSNDLVYTRIIKRARLDTGEHWVELQSGEKRIYQFVRSEEKFQLLLEELKNNTSFHPRLKIPMRTLFDSPKINIIEITNKPDSPAYVNRIISLKTPLPMYIVNRIGSEDNSLLGGIASYVLGGSMSKSKNNIMENSKLIAVMKVIVASDREITVENLIFNDRPSNTDMVPVLEDVIHPDIPLLKGAKMLKWKCNRCLTTTWKFPLQKDTHYCNACPICHKTFMSPASLKKHLVLHKRDGTKYCKECRTSFVSKATINSHLCLHMTHKLCEICHLFVEQEFADQHAEVHSRNAAEQFPCSVCKKVFGSDKELVNHENKFCSRLVAQFTCPTCDKKFFSKTSLELHKEEHKNSLFHLKCRFCPKIFIEESEQCPKKAKKRKTYPIQAGKRKPSITCLRAWHERIHTRARPYSCHSCPKRFRSEEHQLQHTALVHTGLASNTAQRFVYMCNYCDKVFRNENILECHKKQHTDGTIE